MDDVLLTDGRNGIEPKPFVIGAVCWHRQAAMTDLRPDPGTRQDQAWLACLVTQQGCHPEYILPAHLLQGGDGRRGYSNR
jgi:hypothetical protein